MRKIFLLFAIVFTFAVMSQTLLGQGKMPKSVRDEGRWDKVEFDAPAQCEGTPRDCALKMLKDLNIDVGDSPLFSVYRLGEINEKSVTVVFVSQEVSDDDSVSGILYRLALSLGDVEDNSFSLDFLGKQYKCARGRSYWSKNLCP